MYLFHNTHSDVHCISRSTVHTIFSQSNDWSRGPTKLVQYLPYRGSSHRCKSAAWHKFDMFWRYCLPSGGEGGILLGQMISTCRCGLDRGGGQHTVRGVLGNKCAGQRYLETVHFRETLAWDNILAWSSAIRVFFFSALATLGRRRQAFM